MVLNDAYLLCLEDLDEHEFLEAGEAFVPVTLRFVGLHVLHRPRDALRLWRDALVCLVTLRVCSYLKTESTNHRDKIYRNLILILKPLCLIVSENNRGVIETRSASKIGPFY